MAVKNFSLNCFSHTSIHKTKRKFTVNTGCFQSSMPSETVGERTQRISCVEQFGDNPV